MDIARFGRFRVGALRRRVRVHIGIGVDSATLIELRRQVRFAALSTWACAAVSLASL